MDQDFWIDLVHRKTDNGFISKQTLDFNTFRFPKKDRKARFNVMVSKPIVTRYLNLKHLACHPTRFQVRRKKNRKMFIHFSTKLQISNDRNLVFSATDRPTFKRYSNQLENHGKVQLKCMAYHNESEILITNFSSLCKLPFAQEIPFIGYLVKLYPRPSR